MQNEPIISKSYELLKELILQLKHLPKNQRFLLGDKVQGLASETLELLIEAYYSPRSQKKTLLHKVNIILEKLRHYWRICYELGYYNSTVYWQIGAKIDEIGRMVGGWIKSLR